MSARTLYLHVGTHKTGSTSIQAFVPMNWPALASTGVYYPRTGRPARRWGNENVGHHNVAWELNGLADFAPDEGTFEELLEEIERAAAPTVVLSSEDFEWLYEKPEVLERMRASFRRIGYETTVVAYLRAQPEYIQALYVENAKAGFLLNFDAFLAKILETDAFVIDNPRVTCALDYEPFLDVFAGVFGHDRIVVRPYVQERRASALLAEFLDLVGGGALPFDCLLHPSRLNVSPSFYQVLTGLHHGAAARDGNVPDAPTLVVKALAPAEQSAVNRRFDVTSQAEVASIFERFSGANRRVWQRYGAGPPLVDASDLKVRDASEWDASAKQRRVLEAAMHAWNITAATK